MSSIKDLLLVGAGVNGTGTANSVMKWLDADTATDSIITDNGTSIGIGVAARTSGVDTLEMPNWVFEDNGNFGLKVNAYYNGTNNVYINTDEAARFFTDNGSFIFSNAPSGTAGTTVSFQERMRIDSSGKVGIGTSSPAYKLEISETTTPQLAFRRSGSTAGNGEIFSIGNSGVVNAKITLGAGTNNHMTFSTLGTERMFIDSSGNIAIGGSTNASRKLEIVQDSGQVAGVRVNNAGSGAYYQMFSGTANPRIGVSANTDQIEFHTNTGEKMRIDSSGYVGIGTTAPSTYDQYGDNLVVASATHTGITIAAGTTSQSTLMFADGTGGTAGYRGRVGYDHNTDSMFLHTAAAERMRITSGGSLQVGGNNYYTIGEDHLIQGTSETAGVGALMVYNDAGTANVPVLTLGSRDESTDSSVRFIQFYKGVGGTLGAMGGIVGNGASNVQFASISDEREKENITEISGSLDKIMQLRVSEFDWKASGEHINAGFIAQNVETVFPEYVVENIANEGEESRKGITGGMSAGYIAHLTKAIQELKAEIETLKSQINA